jgi:hypothetical protein
MKKALRATEVEALLREIQRYLAYVEALRTSGSATERWPEGHERGRDDA